MIIQPSYHHPIVPSSLHIILKNVESIESSAICYSAHLSYLKKNNKSKPPPQTNFRALLSNHQWLFNCTMLNVIVWWKVPLWQHKIANMKKSLQEWKSRNKPLLKVFLLLWQTFRWQKNVHLETWKSFSIWSWKLFSHSSGNSYISQS